jgi:transcriptional regulator NrdR family protein
MNEKSISVFVVDVWAESIQPGISEIFERLYNQQYLLQDVNMNSRKSEASYAALQTRVSDLQSKLYQVEKREIKQFEVKLLDLNLRNAQKYLIRFEQMLNIT